jgi:competence protein ComGC
MKPAPVRKSQGFTLIELILVIVVMFLIVLTAVIYPQAHVRAKAPRITCLNNLKQVGIAYRIWESDHDDLFPALQSVTNGGWREVLTNANQGFRCWTNYVIMANEMGLVTKVLICPSDERKPADSFTNFANINLSYFVGVSAIDTEPQSLLGGDRNLGDGSKPDPDYGFSPENGKGNDVALQINSKTSPVWWSLKMHSAAAGNSAGAGNILMGDDSAQEVSTLSFRETWLPNANPTTNWPAGHIPSSPSIRVLFP